MKSKSMLYKGQLGRLLLVVFLSGVTASVAVLADQNTAPARPNIIVILADDLGYSDIGVYGSEIATPNIDALANNGVQFSNFYAGPTCAPTRSMLMSGTDNHIAGLGVNSAALHRLTHLRGRPGYEGHLNDQVVSFARLLQDAGYFTSMTGKWDLGAKAGYRPADRGFDRSFSLIDGGGSHFEDASGNLSVSPKANYYEDANKVEKLPAGFFSSEFYTSRLIDYIDSNKTSGKPFFSYLAFTAPHWPLQAPDDWIDKYRGRYDAGWDVMREQRLQRMKAQGLVDKQAQLPPRVHSAAAWQSLTPIARKVEARKMEIYAAMVSNMDYHIGRLVQYLKDSDQYHNTYILFLSDNGAEGNNVGSIMGGEHWVPATFDNRWDNMGRMGSYLWQGAGWAQLSSTPKRIYKAFTTDGGLAVPAIIAYPGMPRAKQRSSAVATVMDIAPTVLELAATRHPGKRYRGRQLEPMRGVSMVPYLRGETDTVHTAEEGLGWEAYGNRALRQGEWKIVLIWPPYGSGQWELYHLPKDPGESQDLAAKYPQKMQQMLASWQQYVSDTGLVEFDRDTGYGR